MAWRDEDGADTVELVLVMPVLVLLLGVLAHLALFLTVRQTTVTAVQQGLVTATAGDLAGGRTTAVDVVGRYSTGEVVSATVTRASATELTVSVTTRSPGVVPGLPRTVTVTQTGVEERWLVGP